MVAIVWPHSTSPGLKPSEGAGRLINCYAEPLGNGARAEYSIHRVPGLAAFGTSSQTGYRGAMVSQNVLYAAFDSKLMKWTSAGGAGVVVGTLNGDAKGFFAQNNAATPDKVFVDPDGNIASFTTSSVTNSFDADLPSVNSVTPLNGYLIFTTGAGQIWATGLNVVTVDALSFTTDQTSGGLVRGITWGQRLYAFGNKTTGVYSDAGSSPFPLAKVTTIPRGIAGPYCVAGFEDNFQRGLHFVGDDNKVYRLDGGLSPSPVSPPDLDGLIESVSDKTTLEMTAYISRGLGFIELSCPAWTWVLNTSTGWWHEKAKSLGARSRISGAVYAFDKWLTGDTDSGDIVEITKDSHIDVDAPIESIVWSLPLQKFPQQIRVPTIWIDAAVGVGDATGEDPIATDPEIEIDWSDDGGLTWSVPRLRKIGPQSEGHTRIRMNQCGRARSQGRIIRVKQSSPVHVGVMGGEMAAELRAA